MNSVIFHPARLHGSAFAPPAKSEAHRALLLAALGRGECRLHGFATPLCDDTDAMIRGVTALGARVIAEGDVLRVIPAPPAVPDAPARHLSCACVRGRAAYAHSRFSCTGSGRALHHGAGAFRPSSGRV